jgi:pilus assembly protein CpaB
LSALRPAAPPTRDVVVAAHEITAGQVLRATDLKLANVPASITPAAAIADTSTAIGKTTATTIDAGEVVTPARLVGAGLLAGTSQLVEVPVRLADASSASLVVPGQVIDVIAATDSNAWTVAAGVRVLAIPGGGSGPTGSSGMFGSGSGSNEDVQGGLIVLAVDTKTAIALAKASVHARLSISVRPTS